MAKTLTLDVTSFKFADNETDLSFTALKNGVIVSDNTLSAVIKIKQVDDGYLKSVSGKWVNNHIVISSGDLSDLPIGSYLVELWLIGSNGYEIYPDSGFIKLNINQNATGISGNLVSSLTLSEFQQHFSDLSKEILDNLPDGKVGPQGEKGDTGAQGVQGIQGERGERGERGQQGIQGIQGVAGKDFSIVKTFPNVVSMTGTGLTTGDFVIISSTIEDPDNAKLYLWNGTGFTFVTDMSGATGIKGDTGEQGDKGDTGLQGPKGDKGDTGTVDNAGLTSAPAFVSLQTQVNNSAVGTNLLTGTSGNLKTKQVTNDYNVGPQATNGSFQIKVVSGQPYTYRAWLDNTIGSINVYVNVRFSSDLSKSSVNLGNGTAISKGGTGYSSLTFTPWKDGYVMLTPFAASSVQTILAAWQEEKLENGNTPTDWTPAPTDVPINDSNLVHKTGTETVAGDKTFTGNSNFSGATTLKTGNYGLRVTTAGVQKTSDNGLTWTNI